MSERTAFPENVPGDFYVEDGCCMMCEMPFAVAPELFGTGDHPVPHCYVKRQPETADEVDRMLAAAHAAEAQCIRYRGSERPIQVRLFKAGEGTVCDYLPPDLRERQQERDHALEQRRKRWIAAQGWRPSRLPWWSRLFWWTWSLVRRMRRLLRRLIMGTPPREQEP